MVAVKKALVPAMIGALLAGGIALPIAPAAAADPSCRSIKPDIVRLSKKKAKGGVYATRISGAKTLQDHVANPPLNGTVLKCKGTASLSSGYRQKIHYGVKTVNGKYFGFITPVGPPRA